MKNTEVKGLLSQLRTAAEGIKAQIHEADQQIAMLTAQRSVLANATVSKEDVMVYVRADIQRRAVSYQYQLKKFTQKNDSLFTFAKLEREHVKQNLQPFPYLDGEIPNPFAELSPGALYWHFGDLIAERFNVALDCYEWPVDSISVADRRLQLREIDKKLQEIDAKRDELANDLISSGMYE